MECSGAGGYGAPEGSSSRTEDDSGLQALAKFHEKQVDAQDSASRRIIDGTLNRTLQAND